MRKILVAFLFLVLAVAEAKAADVACGWDTDRNGSVDSFCPGDDSDHDGYAADVDCDDENWQVYPGITIACDAGGGAETGWKTCESSGSFTSCTANTTPFCEATGSGTCYYIDKVAGSDSNAGTYAAPWASARNITYSEAEGSRPASWVGITAGDAIYYFDGTYTEKWSGDVRPAQISFAGNDGTLANPIIVRSYPGEDAVILDGSGNATGSSGIWIGGSSYIYISGLKLTRWDNAISSYNDPCAGYKIFNVTAYNNYGNGDDNVDSFEVQNCTGCEVHHNILYDMGTSTGNSTNVGHITLYDGTGNKVHHNYFEGTSDADGNYCLKHKHSASGTDATFEAYQNVFNGCKGAAYYGGMAGTNVHHNLVLGSFIMWSDLNEDGHFRNISFKNNTFSGERAGFIINASELNSTVPETMTLWVEDNVVETTTETMSCGLENSLIRFNTYGTDSDLKTKVLTISTVNNNCYHAPNSVAQFDYWCGDLGAYYSTFSGWKTATGFDAASYEVDPELDGDYIPAAASCDGMGWSEGWEVSGGGGSEVAFGYVGRVFFSGGFN